MDFIKNIASALSFMFYPKLCSGCNQVLNNSNAPVCMSCLIILPLTNYEKRKNNPVYENLKRRINIENACAFLSFSKGGEIQNIINQIKYKNNTLLAEYMGDLFGHKLFDSELYNNIDSIVPMPLHKDKLRFRGYNQSEKIGQGISKSLNIPVNSQLVKRIKYTLTQTKKNRLERWNNVKDAFEIIEYNSLPNHVLLIDDVMTTGSTIEACAIKLIEKNVRVSIAVIGIAEN